MIKVSYHNIRAHFQRHKHLDYVIIFGSAVKQLKADSDIDLLVAGPFSPTQKTAAAMALEEQIGRKIDIIHIKEAGVDLALEAFAKGKLLVLNNMNRLKQDYFQKRREDEDNIPLRRIRAAKLRRELARG